MSNIAGNVLISNVRNYSGTQRAGFTGILVGFIMCCVGCFVPYWKTGSISLETPMPGLTVKMLEIRQGLWMFCYKVIGMEEKCVSTYDMNNAVLEVRKALYMKDNSMVAGQMVLYVGSILCLGLALTSGLAACCRFCCCSGGKTMCHGFLTFLAGACGITVATVFIVKGNDILGITFVNDSEDYGWAFFVFTIGSGILTISSFMLCFSSPRMNAYHYQNIPTPNAGFVVVQSSNTNQTMMSAAAPAQGPVMNHEMTRAPYSNPGSSEFATY